MSAKRARFLHVMVLAASLGGPSLASDPETVLRPTGEPQEELVLVGVVSRAEIESVMPEWVAEVVVAQPDLEAATDMVAALAGAKVTVFFGTWCSDSGRELPRLWRALDEVGTPEPVEILYVAVDRDKSEPRDLLAGQDLQWVPTFVVERAGVELGRIVESSPAGIEKDLLALLSARLTGSISDNPLAKGSGEEL